MEDEIGDLQVVLVLHDHVAVAANAALWRREHLGLAAGVRDAADHRLTALETGLPGGEVGKAGRGVAIIAEDDENGKRRQRLDLLVGVVRRATTRFDEDEPFGDRRIQQRRGEGKRSRLRVSHQHRAIHLTGEIRQRLERGVRSRHAAKTHVGDTLLRQFVHGGHRELSVREGSARLRTEAEVRPDHFIAEPNPSRQTVRRRRARARVVEDGLIESRSPASDLIRDIDGMALADEVLVPSHATVRRGLPGFARQRRAMHHHHRHVAIAALRHHVAHVHLIDGDVPARAEVAQLTLPSVQPFRHRQRSCPAPSAPTACQASERP